MANTPFKITTPAGAGLLRDPSTGQLRSGKTDETPAVNPTLVTRGAGERGVGVLREIVDTRRPDTASAPIPRAPMAAPPLPFKVS